MSSALPDYSALWDCTSKTSSMEKARSIFPPLFDGITLELYPLQSKQEATNHARLGFLVDRGGLESVIAAWTLQRGTRVLPPELIPLGAACRPPRFDGPTGRAHWARL